jgi:lipopolysaccharide/colanic/teichoic acid biosynthesis glycosyltransferase
MISLDIEYVCRRSLRMNLWIVARTPLKVVDLRRAA